MQYNGQEQRRAQELFNQLAPGSGSKVSREEVNMQHIIKYYGRIDIKCFSQMKTRKQCNKS